MKKLFNLRQSIILSTVFIILLHSCSAQNNSADQEMDSLKLEIKIIKSIPVGWGVIYQGNIQKIVEGKTHVFNDSISFGITASKDFEYVNIDDICIITFKNSKEISKTSYLPPINGTVSNKNEIWLISKIDIKSNINK